MMIPVIDFAKVKNNSSSELNNLRYACEKWGLFYLDNTDIPDSSIATIVNRSKEFFTLNKDIKQLLELNNSKNFTGYVGVGEETTNGKPDLKESLEFAQESVIPENLTFLPFHQLYGTNQWLNESILPGFKADVIAYFQQIETLGNQLMQCFVKSLGIPLENHDDYYHQSLYYRTRFIYYEPMSSLSKEEFRIHPHTDMALFNILFLDKPSLEVQDSQGEWHSVLPRKGTFVIILGELTQMWTKGLYKAGVHRVRNHELNEVRLSIPFFFYPNLLSPVKCFQKDTEANKPDSKPLLAGEMLWNRLNSVHY